MFELMILLCGELGMLSGTGNRRIMLPARVWVWAKFSTHVRLRVKLYLVGASMRWQYSSGIYSLPSLDPTDRRMAEVDGNGSDLLSYR